ncbi:MAG: DUF6165 family protein [Gammaproteobacteria bacterium]
MSIEISVSVGEFLDKLTILQIKADRISEPGKLANIRRELESLAGVWRQTEYAAVAGMEDAIQDLRLINEQLWDIEDAIREKEARQEFDNDFIELARSVYITNDRRAAVKRGINEMAGSGLMEEKSYRDYQ